MDICGRLVTDGIPVAILTAGSKQIGVAVIVAGFPDGPYDNGDFTNTCIALLGKTANAHGFFGTLHRVELATEAGTPVRIEMTLATAEDGDTLVFMCADAAIFDVAWRTLNVRKWP